MRVTTVSLVGARGTFAGVPVPARVDASSIVAAVPVEVEVRLELELEIGSALTQRRDDITLLWLGSWRGRYGHGTKQRGYSFEEAGHCGFFGLTGLRSVTDPRISIVP